MRSIVAYLLNKIISWINKIEYLDPGEKVPISYCHIKEVSKPLIIFYKRKGCKLCDEIGIFLEIAWIPHKIIDIRQSRPVVIPSRRDIQGFVQHDCKDLKTKEKFKLFLVGAAPQLEFVWRKNGENQFQRFVADTRQMREKLDEFIFQNSKYFPGFERGIYQDRDPEQQKEDKPFLHDEDN